MSQTISIVDKSFHDSLKAWIESTPGGYIHPSLKLFHSVTEKPGNTDFQFPNRGIKSTAVIPENTLLIRIPFSLVLSGQNVQTEKRMEINIQKQSATEIPVTSNFPSPWLKCMGALIIEKKKFENKVSCNDPSLNSSYAPYLESLPKSFDTLQTWSIDEVESFLRGTTLGDMVIIDRKENRTKKRFEQSVRPYLQSLGQKNSDFTWEDFLWASQCISTRGFHMEDESQNLQASLDDNSSHTYSGPFLLPYIDLLNHDPILKCTTLHRTTIDIHQDENTILKESVFYMLAERNISAGEEIFHSYYSSKISGEVKEGIQTKNNDLMTPTAQLLQTFGFVSKYHMESACRLDINNAASECKYNNKNETVAVISLNGIIQSCKHVAFSKWVATFCEENRNFLAEQQQDYDEDMDNEEMYWDPTQLWEEKVNYLQNKQNFLSEQLLVTDIDSIATCCILLLLPKEAFYDLFVLDKNPTILEAKEIFGKMGTIMNDDDNNSNSTIADDDDDPWLATLAGMAVSYLVEERVKKYFSQSINDTFTNALNNKIKTLTDYLTSNGKQPANINRIMAGLSIQIEELRSLEYLRRHALEWIKISPMAE